MKRVGGLSRGIMRTAGSVVLAVSIAASGVGIGAASNGKARITSVDVFSPLATDQFWQACNKASERTARDLGIPRVSEFDANQKVETQASQLDTAIAARPSVILLAAVDSKAVIPQVVAARKQGIVVMAYNTALPATKVDGTVAMDEVATGATAARTMIGLAKRRGLTSLTVLHLVGDVATEPVRLRRLGFDEVMAKPVPGLRIKVIDKVTNWQPELAVNAVQDTLASTKINAIFTESDFLTPFFVPVLQRAGFTPAGGRHSLLIAGLGGIPGGIKAIRDGWEDFTLNYPIDGMCNASLRWASAILAGKSIDSAFNQIVAGAGLLGNAPRLVKNDMQGPAILLTANLVNRQNVNDKRLWANRLFSAGR